MSVCMYVCVCAHSATCIMYAPGDMCVYAPLMLLITSGMIWHDIDPYDWLNKLYSFYIAVRVGVVSRHGLTIEACPRNHPDESKLGLCKP